jgi:uncharacterized membrane protein YqhA
LLARGTLVATYGDPHAKGSIPVSRLISYTRFLIVIPALGSFVAATVLLGYGAVEIVELVGKAVAHEVDSKMAKTLALGFIEVVDLFLLGTVLYIIALGLYELFIDDRLTLPHWLEIHTLDDLKDKLTGVVILVMGVLFLGQAVTWDGQRNLLPYGAAIALVITALTFFLSNRPRKSHAGDAEDAEDAAGAPNHQVSRP